MARLRTAFAGSTLTDVAGTQGALVVAVAAPAHGGLVARCWPLHAALALHAGSEGRKEKTCDGGSDAGQNGGRAGGGGWPSAEAKPRS